MATPNEQQDLTTVLSEKRLFAPPPAFAAKAHVPSMEEFEKLTKQAASDVPAFWAKEAESLAWSKKWTKPLDGAFPDVKWFAGGELNLTESCLDRHLTTWRRNKAALIWEGEPGDSRTLTYFELHREVCRFANVLAHYGVKKGDRVCIYMPLVPEAAIAMLACARMGAVHSVVFGGFSAEALRDRINDAQAAMVITADGGWRRGQIVPLKENVDAALKSCPTVKEVIVLERTKHGVPMKGGRDHWWHEAIEGVKDEFAAVPVEPLV
jgi:acetyl-CoA synthetase